MFSQPENKEICIHLFKNGLQRFFHLSWCLIGFLDQGPKCCIVKVVNMTVGLPPAKIISHVLVGRVEYCSAVKYRRIERFIAVRKIFTPIVNKSRCEEAAHIG